MFRARTGLVHLAFFVVFFILPVTAPASGFSLSCQLLDPVTMLERTSFAPGETMAVSYVVEIPREAGDREVVIKLSSRLSVGGIAVPFTLDELRLSFPNEDLLPPEADEEPGLLDPGYRSELRTIEISSDFPPGSAMLRAKASIEGVGTQTCELQAQIIAQ